MKLLANGCSMTHGQELVTDGYDPDNTKLCYAHKIFENYSIWSYLFKALQTKLVMVIDQHLDSL